MMRRRKQVNHDRLAAEEALDLAKIGLSHIRSRTSEVKRVSTSLRDLRERNHFAEALNDIMKGHK